MIEIAFTNGIVAAAKLDLAHIEKLQNDDSLLQSTAHSLRDDYIALVQRMNAPQDPDRSSHNPDRYGNNPEGYTSYKGRPWLKKRQDYVGSYD